VDDDDDAGHVLAFAEPEGWRYEDGGVLGRGGMGEIRAVHDRRLGRTVALKTPVEHSPSASRQLVAEASLTAKLVHPGIIAVHGAGIGRDGRPYYTMPVVRGRGLDEAIDESRDDLGERLRLVRHFLDACEAIGYAHSEGVVHRDLKPSNILVGRFGKTTVVDWGLAAPVGNTPTGVVGTAAYMPPEQRLGDVVDPRADVFALGVTLREILCGSTTNDFDPATPPELVAIVDRATHPEPENRYRDGRALAEEVVAWFEGRRVAAHDYTLLELVGRVWATHRSVVLIALVAAVGIATATAIGVHRTASAHDDALQARERAEQNLAQARLSQALTAAQQDAWAEAELAATAALAHGDAARARGVLARFDRAARPQRVAHWPLPGCRRLAVSADGATIACANAGSIVVATPSADWTTAPRLEAKGDPRAVLDADTVLVDNGTLGLYVEAVSGGFATLEAPGARQVQPHSHSSTLASWIRGSAEFWGRIGSRVVEETGVCRDHASSVPATTAVRHDDARVVLCQSGAVLLATTGAFRPVVSLPAEAGAPLVAAFDRDGARLAVGTASGDAMVLDLDQGAIVRRVDSRGTPSDLALHGDRLALSDGRGRVRVWQVSSGALVVSLASERARVRWTDAGRLRLVTDVSVEDWALPTAVRPHVLHSATGISALSPSPDGRRVLSAHGDGVVRVWDVGAAEPIDELALHWSVVKDVQWSVDGRSALAVCAQDDQLHWIDLDRRTTRTETAAAGTRVGWMSGDRAMLASYRGGLLVWNEGVYETELQVGETRIVDMETHPDRRGATLLGAMGTIARIPDLAPLQPRVVAHRKDATAVAGTADAIIVLRTSVIERLDRNGSLVASSPLEGEVTEVALSSDGQTIAVAHLDGRISMLDAEHLEPLATFEGHSGRVSSVEFGPRDRWLYSGGWDGDVRQWSLASLRADAETLRREAIEAWPSAARTRAP